VNPQTLNFTQVGTFTTSTSNPSYDLLVPSPNDHFLYFVGRDSNQIDHLWVYATDASGAPLSPAVQEMAASGLKELHFDPKANFLYAVFGIPTSDGNQTTYSIQRFLVDPSTGVISQPVVEASQTLNSYAGYTCYLSIQGFNANASKLYDQVYCGTHEDEFANYYGRTVDSQTGTLGPDVQIHAWAYSIGDNKSEIVQFVGNHMFNFVSNGYPSVQSINIYYATPNTSKPLVQCTASMVPACGAFWPNGTAIHPSGKYVFVASPSGNSSEILRVDLIGKKLVDTSQQVQYAYAQFSPDGTLVYSNNYTGPGYYVTVNGFNMTTAKVTTGGQIFVPQGSGTFDYFYAARRF
jgi:hypothetical protein